MAKTFAWTMEGLVRSGTLAEYARDRQTAETSGLAISDEVWDGIRTVAVTVVADPISSDLMQRYELECCGQTARYSVDARG